MNLTNKLQQFVKGWPVLFQFLCFRSLQDMNWKLWYQFLFCYLCQTNFWVGVFICILLIQDYRIIKPTFNTVYSAYSDCKHFAQGRTRKYCIALIVIKKLFWYSWAVKQWGNELLVEVKKKKKKRELQNSTNPTTIKRKTQPTKENHQKFPTKKKNQNMVKCIEFWEQFGGR